MKNRIRLVFLDLQINKGNPYAGIETSLIDGVEGDDNIYSAGNKTCVGLLKQMDISNNDCSIFKT